MRTQSGWEEGRTTRRAARSIFLLAVLLVIGGWLGNFVGVMAGNAVPVLGRSIAIGIDPPFKVALDFLTFTFGLTLHLNLVGLIGLVLAVFAWTRS